MSQKINSISNRLGISQTWNITFSKYGKNFKLYNKLYNKQLKILLYITYLLAGRFSFLDSITINFENKCFFINIFFFSSNEIKTLPKTNFLSKICFNWLKTPMIFNFYKRSTLTNSAFLLSNYILNLVFRETFFKRVLKNIYILLKNQVNKFKLVYTTQGIRELKLKGFKLQFSGCFDLSRTQMAKTMHCNFGSLSLTKLNGYTEYSVNTIYTKFGSCGLKIWLFYEFKSL